MQNKIIYPTKLRDNFFFIFFKLNPLHFTLFLDTQGSEMSATGGLRYQKSSVPQCDATNFALHLKFDVISI